MILASVIPASAGAASKQAWGAATVACDVLNIRSGPGTSYAIVGTTGENSIVVVIEKTNKEWYLINFDGTTGYSKAEYFSDIVRRENFNATATITGDSVRVRQKPGTSYTVLATVDNGDEVAVIGINDGWYKVKTAGITGYLRSDFAEISGGYQAKTKGNSASSTGSKIADFALKYVGYSYVAGAESPAKGFDCSGLVYYTYGQFGVKLSRSSASMYANNGTKVAKADLRPGDLVFFSGNGKTVTHVGIYIGDDQFVHASGVKTGVIVSRLDSAYYIRAYFGAKRIGI
jgi:cell wall-associated NlpC family hydrolase